MCELKKNIPLNKVIHAYKCCGLQPRRWQCDSAQYKPPELPVTQAGQTRLSGTDLYSIFMTEFMPNIFPLTSSMQTDLLPALTHLADTYIRL